MASRGRHIAAVLIRHSVRSLRLDSGARRKAFAQEMREAFEELGPAFIKLGQLISVRPDLFGPEMIFEMEALRDAVPAMPGTVIRDVIEAAFGRRIDELFDEFEDEPVASASIAQVHRAVLREPYRPVVGPALEAGTPLAIKVVRPGVRASILADVAAAARPLAARLSRIPPLCRFNLPGLLDEFAESLVSECDLRREARVADRFAFDFRDDPLLVVPRVVWPMTSARVLAMEYVEGWRLSEITEAERRGIDGRELALHGAKLFMRQVLELGRFHADLHPSNLFVTPDGKIAYLDFGIIGRTEAASRTAIAQVLAATVYGDADRALKYSAELGLVVPEESQGKVRGRVAELMEATLSTPPRDIKGFAIGFLRIMNDERVTVPIGYGLLIKALVTVEGCARQLYPDIDITEAAKPYATQLIAKRMMQPARLAERMPDALRAALRELAQ